MNDNPLNNSAFAGDHSLNEETVDVSAIVARLKATRKPLVRCPTCESVSVVPLPTQQYECYECGCVWP